MAGGSLQVYEYPTDVVRLSCAKCGRTIQRAKAKAFGEYARSQTRKQEPVRDPVGMVLHVATDPARPFVVVDNHCVQLPRSIHSRGYSETPEQAMTDFKSRWSGTWQGDLKRCNRKACSCSPARLRSEVRFLCGVYELSSGLPLN